MAAGVEEKPVDRRKLVAGAVAFVAGGAFMMTEEGIAAETAEWVPAHVAGPAEGRVVEVVPLMRRHRVAVELEPGAIVHSELALGSGVLVEGHQRRDGSISARRVIHGVFGVRPDSGN